MGYKKAAQVLPKDLLAKVQKYVDGEFLYIPRAADNKKCWGETTTTRREIKERNRQIYADYEILCKNGADGVELPPYTIIGEGFSLTESVELQIKNRYKIPVKISKIIKEKLQLSQSEYLRLIENGNVKSVPAKDLKTYKLKHELTIIFKGSS